MEEQGILDESQGAGVITVDPKEYSEMPPSAFVEGRHFPLIIQLLDSLPLYETFNLKQDSLEVDRLLNEELKLKGMPDTQASYERELTQLLEELKIDESMLPYDKFEKMLKFLKIKEKLRNSAREDTSFLESDPLTLSADKLKLYLERKHALQ